MIPFVLLVARLFSAPVPHVALVVRAAISAGTDPAVAVSRVEWEASFDPTAERFNAWDGSTDWSFGQLNNRYHDQHRCDLRAHVVAMERFQAVCNRRAAGDPRLGLAIYHRWTLDAQGLAYADAVLVITEIVRDQTIGGFYGYQSLREGVRHYGNGASGVSCGVQNWEATKRIYSGPVRFHIVGIGRLVQAGHPERSHPAYPISSAAHGGERRDKAPGQARRAPEAIPERPVWRQARAGRLITDRREGMTA